MFRSIVGAMACPRPEVACPRLEVTKCKEQQKMHFAINTPNFDLYSDVRLLAELAHEAEEAGWDGFFIWDHIGAGPEWPAPVADPWVALTAMAMTTKRIKIGPIVTPLPRRRPWKE